MSPAFPYGWHKGRVNKPSRGPVSVGGLPGAPDPVVDDWLFNDQFATGAKAGSQNGVAWTGVNLGSGLDAVAVEADAGNSTGFSLVFTFDGGSDGGAGPGDDAQAEQRFILPDLTSVHLRMRFYVDAAYEHRDDIGGPDNNKLLRLWDDSYDDSRVHLGMSTNPRVTGESIVIVEYNTPGTEFNGPFNVIFTPNTEVTLDFYTQVSSGAGVADGIIKLWKNGTILYNHSDLELWNTSTNPGAFNGFGNGYVMGWANSGFDILTKIYLRQFTVYDHIPSGL